MSVVEDERVYMDIDDEWTLQDITMQIAQFRKDTSLETLSENSVTTLSPLTSQKFKSSLYLPVIVVDTNFLISHLSFLKTLFREHNKKCKFLVIIPWIVLEELDGLKSRSSNSYENSSKTNQPDVAKLAQRAISFLHDCLAEKHDGIRGQKINEKIEKPKNNDDKILDCCRYFQITTRNSIILLSNDKNLCVKAMVHDIYTFSFQKACGLEGLLVKILSTVNSSSDSDLHKQDGSMMQLPKVNKLEIINEQENRNGSNTVYDLKQESECFTEDSDIIMMDCDDTIQKTALFPQNVVTPESSGILQISPPVNSRSSLSHENRCNPSYLSLYDSIHAPDNRKKKLEDNNNKKKTLSTDYSSPKKSTMDCDDMNLISEPSASTHRYIPYNSIQNSPLLSSHSVQASYSPFPTQDEFKYNSSLSSLYASIHAPENFDEFTDYKGTNHANYKANRETEVISMMLFTTPSISKNLLVKAMETSQKRLVNKIIINLSNILPPAILFHFQVCFGKDWNYIIQESQPWSLSMMIKFIDRYWMTVFSDVFHQSRKIKEVVISSMQDFLRVYQRSDARLTVQEMMQFIQNSELILKMIYDGIEETVDSVSEREQLFRNWWNEFEHSLIT